MYFIMFPLPVYFNRLFSAADSGVGDMALKIIVLNNKFDFRGIETMSMCEYVEDWYENKSRKGMKSDPLSCVKNNQIL